MFDSQTLVSILDQVFTFWFETLFSMPLWYSILVALLTRLFHQQIYEFFSGVFYDGDAYSAARRVVEESQLKIYVYSALIVMLGIPIVSSVLIGFVGLVIWIIVELIPFVAVSLYARLSTGDYGGFLSWITAASAPHIIAYASLLDWQSAFDKNKRINVDPS